ncbi:aromatic hydrocarbon degradation protein [Ilyomonas limi]|uniref:Aromatic hydrocarbon degradation protein n=1 Tax=Ilyomonas limi TaxID=2575867 RepID=A0A4U3KWI1_9BACT|nr:aromatic hydrocarbon degradation protein [Ilyomonas limi]TKK66014.1 aromatic hydrocarbon degradation protein [Ilyomonas limi]
MKKCLFTAMLLFVAAIVSYAQLPEDVLRYSYFQQQGTARSIAIGGAMGSLGGDISAMYVNPAGLGMYRTSEIVISPGFRFNNNKADFRGTSFQSNKTGFNLGTTGAVFGNGSPYSRNRSEAFSIGISQTANFNNTLTYKGLNDYSSYSEQFSEEVARSGYSNFDAVLNDPSFAFGSSLAIDTYLIDTFNNGSIIKGYPEFILQNGGALNQEKTIKTSGGIYEIALGYAANTNDKFYWGLSIGIPIVSYTRNTFFRESDATDNTNNGFNYSEWNDKLTTNGAGLNGKIGLIYKPAGQVRLGLAVHTPSFYILTDRESASMITDAEGSAPYQSSSTRFIDGGIGSTRYSANSPWKFIASASYVINEVSDVTKQRGFITADVEYNTYSSGSFSATDAESSSSNSYYDALKSIIKANYKGAFNFRLGGELKFNTLMVRLGGAYYGNPYKNSDLSSNITQLGGGLGYRNKGIFIDLGYAYVMNKNVDFPYRLQDKANTFASYKNNQNNVILTVGFKL